jgi:hypothetical protein
LKVKFAFIQLEYDLQLSKGLIKESLITSQKFDWIRIDLYFIGSKVFQQNIYNKSFGANLTLKEILERL